MPEDVYYEVDLPTQGVIGVSDPKVDRLFAHAKAKPGIWAVQTEHDRDEYRRIYKIAIQRREQINAEVVGRTVRAEDDHGNPIREYRVYARVPDKKLAF